MHLSCLKSASNISNLMNSCASKRRVFANETSLTNRGFGHCFREPWLDADLWPNRTRTCEAHFSLPAPKRREKEKPRARPPDQVGADQRALRPNLRGAALLLQTIQKRQHTPPKVAAQRIGLGLTLFMRDSNGLSLRVDPSREFRKGDHVRVLLETNADGYLYIFNTTDGGTPLMIYPDAELDEAAITYNRMCQWRFLQASLLKRG